MEKEPRELYKDCDKEDKKTFYGLKEDESLLTAKFAPPENPDLRE